MWQNWAYRAVVTATLFATPIRASTFGEVATTVDNGYQVKWFTCSNGTALNADEIPKEINNGFLFTRVTKEQKKIMGREIKYLNNFKRIESQLLIEKEASNITPTDLDIMLNEMLLNPITIETTYQLKSIQWDPKGEWGSEDRLIYVNSSGDKISTVFDGYAWIITDRKGKKHDFWTIGAEGHKWIVYCNNEKNEIQLRSISAWRKEGTDDYGLTKTQPLTIMITNIYYNGYTPKQSSDFDF